MRVLKSANAFNAPIYWRAVGSSTMQHAWQLARAYPPHGTAVGLNYQWRGRGQKNRRWHARWGESLLLSIILTDPSCLHLPALSLRGALAVATMLEHALGIHPHIKWPNDILVREQKLGGILTEIKDSIAVMGIGINCLARRFPPSVRARAISLRQVVGNRPDIRPHSLVPHLLRALHTYLVIADWRQRILNRLWRPARPVNIQPIGGEVRPVTICGLTEDGALLAQERGSTAPQRYYAGEIEMDSGI